MIKTFLGKYLEGEEKLVVACSGGSDSMFLLDELLAFYPKEKIIVGHFDHSLRGEESDKDAEFVKSFCDNKGITSEVGKHDIRKFSETKKISLEEAARIKRYEFLEKLREKHDAVFILTAHHLDDSIETFLFNLIRGTKLNGLTGIDEKNGLILRPLSHMTKEKIIEECLKRKLEFREDSSNKDDTMLRNHIRLNISPLFEKINKNYRNNLDELMLYFRDMQFFMEKNILSIVNGKYHFSVEEFQRLDPFMQKELIAYIFKITNSGTVGLSRGNIQEVIRFIGSKGNNTVKDIKEMHLKKMNGKVYFS